MILFASTILLSAFLLFLVQPIIAKQILPWFGGTSAVWITCLVFFQVLLLAGYTYAHVITRRFSMRRQTRLHIVLLLASLLFLPIIPSAALKPTADADAALRILLLLAATIGLPYFLLSTTGPLLQKWVAPQLSGKVRLSTVCAVELRFVDRPARISLRCRTLCHIHHAVDGVECGLCAVRRRMQLVGMEGRPARRATHRRDG